MKIANANSLFLVTLKDFHVRPFHQTLVCLRHGRFSKTRLKRTTRVSGEEAQAHQALSCVELSPHLSTLAVCAPTCGPGYSSKRKSPAKDQGAHHMPPSMPLLLARNARVKVKRRVRNQIRLWCLGVRLLACDSFARDCS